MQDWTIKACDLDTEHTHVLHSLEKKSDKLAGVSIEVHIALTPLQPWLFFGAHRQMIVNGNYIQSFSINVKYLMSSFWLIELKCILFVEILLYLVLIAFSGAVVGTVEGSKPVTKIRTDLKKPITDLACHPRGPYLVHN
jgi:type IV secretory pathway TrbD component